MYLDLMKILSGKKDLLTFENDIVVPAFELELLGITKAKPIKFQGQVKVVDSSLLMTVHYEASFEAECNRCLDPVNISFHEMLERELVRASEDDDLRLDVLVYEKTGLDILPVILDDIALKMPLQLLCDEECQGLCHKCGQNLNHGECKCDRVKVDPRLESLKNFFT